MKIGEAGKYDDLCTLARESAKARGVILIVIGGLRGEGFSVQTTDPRVLIALPKILRGVASDIEKEGFSALE
jgi:hypothetical protein